MQIILNLPIYIINALRFADRWEHVRWQLDPYGLNYRRITEPDGYELTDEDVAACYDHTRNQRGFELTRPEIGNYLSHRSIWQSVLDEGHRAAFVFEDDFTVKDGFPHVTAALDDAEFDRPTVVRLESHRYGWVRAIYKESLVGEFTLRTPLMVPLGAAGYWINRAACERLTNQRRRFSRPVDNDMACFWETGVDVKEVYPGLVDHPNFPDRPNESITSVRRPFRVMIMATPQGRLRWWANRKKFLVLSAVHTPRRLLRKNRIKLKPDQ